MRICSSYSLFPALCSNEDTEIVSDPSCVVFFFRANMEEAWASVVLNNIPVTAATPAQGPLKSITSAIATPVSFDIDWTSLLPSHHWTTSSLFRNIGYTLYPYIYFFFYYLQSFHPTLRIQPRFRPTNNGNIILLMCAEMPISGTRGEYFDITTINLTPNYPSGFHAQIQIDISSLPISGPNRGGKHYRHDALMIEGLDQWIEAQ
ncbi:hypothetical protein V8F33_005564 [Rhypophila sp. PSN 637]